MNEHPFLCVLGVFQFMTRKSISGSINIELTVTQVGFSLKFCLVALQKVLTLVLPY